jgi:hypothetical protein
MLFYELLNNYNEKMWDTSNKKFKKLRDSRNAKKRWKQVRFIHVLINF